MKSCLIPLSDIIDYETTESNSDGSLKVRLNDDVNCYFDNISCIDYSHSTISSFISYEDKFIFISADSVRDSDIEFIFDESDIEVLLYLRMKYPNGHFYV